MTRYHFQNASNLLRLQRGMDVTNLHFKFNFPSGVAPRIFFKWGPVTKIRKGEGWGVILL